ncbi:MAG: hypothetical protein MHPSP_001346 [Paramarteilia canceri]
MSAISNSDRVQFQSVLNALNDSIKNFQEKNSTKQLEIDKKEYICKMIDKFSLIWTEIFSVKPLRKNDLVLDMNKVDYNTDFKAIGNLLTMAQMLQHDKTDKIKKLSDQANIIGTNLILKLSVNIEIFSFDLIKKVNKAKLNSKEFTLVLNSEMDAFFEDFQPILKILQQISYLLDPIFKNIMETIQIQLLSFKINIFDNHFANIVNSELKSICEGPNKILDGFFFVTEILKDDALKSEEYFGNRICFLHYKEYYDKIANYYKNSIKDTIYYSRNSFPDLMKIGTEFKCLAVEVIEIYESKLLLDYINVFIAEILEYFESCFIEIAEDYFAQTLNYTQYPIFNYEEFILKLQVESGKKSFEFCTPIAQHALNIIYQMNDSLSHSMFLAFSSLIIKMIHASSLSFMENNSSFKSISIFHKTMFVSANLLTVRNHIDELITDNMESNNSNFDILTENNGTGINKSYFIYIDSNVKTMINSFLKSWLSFIVSNQEEQIQSSMEQFNKLIKDYLPVYFTKKDEKIVAEYILKSIVEFEKENDKKDTFSIHIKL